MSEIDRVGFTNRTADETAAQPARNAKLDEAAKLMEKQFLREMVRAMRGTVSFGAMKPSMGEMIYRGELDNQYVESWGDTGGVGLADLIYDQVMEKYFNSTQGRALKGQPIPITERDISRVVRLKSEVGESQVPLRVELGASSDGRATKLQVPWAAEVVSNLRLEGGKTALTLRHGPSLSSTLVFQGVSVEEVKVGAKLEQGRTIGVLSPEINSFFWNLKQSSAPLDASRGSESANGLQGNRLQGMNDENDANDKENL